MPEFAIVITKENTYGWWKYTLVIKHKPHPCPEHYATAQAAFQAALFEANRKGYYNE